MKYILLHFCLTILFIPILLLQISGPYIDSFTLKVNNNSISVKNWMLMSSANNTNEIVKKLGDILMKKHVGRSKIEINLIETLPALQVNVDNHSVNFFDHHIKYSKGCYIGNGNTDFNKFTCAENLQVNVSKCIRELTLRGITSIQNHLSTFSITLGDVLISNVRNLQVINNELVTATESSTTNIQYRIIKHVINSTNEENGPIILSVLHMLIKHLKSYYHESIDELILGNITANLPVPADFQCSPNGNTTDSELSNKVYIIDNTEIDQSWTHTVQVGPVVITGFSNITSITVQYAWSEHNSRKANYETVININPLYLKSDWNIISLRNNEFNGTDSFKITKIRLSSTKDGSSYSFNVEAETSVYKWPLISTDDIFCIILDKLILDSLSKSLYDYSSTY